MAPAMTTSPTASLTTTSYSSSSRSSADDAAQVRALHEGLDDRVIYHVLLPMEDAAAQIEASMGSLSAGEMMASPTIG